jgi:hypothetical protein
MPVISGAPSAPVISCFVLSLYFFGNLAAIDRDQIEAFSLSLSLFSTICVCAMSSHHCSSNSLANSKASRNSGNSSRQRYKVAVPTPKVAPIDSVDLPIFQAQLPCPHRLGRIGLGDLLGAFLIVFVPLLNYNLLYEKNHCSRWLSF